MIIPCKNIMLLLLKRHFSSVITSHLYANQYNQLFYLLLNLLLTVFNRLWATRTLYTAMHHCKMPTIAYLSAYLAYLMNHTIFGTTITWLRSLITISREKSHIQLQQQNALLKVIQNKLFQPKFDLHRFRCQKK